MIPQPSTLPAILDKLEATDRDIVQSYIAALERKVQELESGTIQDELEEETTIPSTGDATANDNEPPFPPTYSSGEDYEEAATAKQAASECVGSGDWTTALEHYTRAVQAAPPSALLLANRAACLLQLGRPRAALADCNMALTENPDSAKALRMRGKARKELGMWEAALQDLSASQAIDFDENTVNDLKFLTEKHLEAEKHAAEERLKDEEKKRKRAEEIRQAKQEQKHQQQPREEPPTTNNDFGFPPGDMPTGAVPGGFDMAGMMGALMNDPELVAALQNPKVQAAFQKMMAGGPAGLLSNPAKMQELMSDPEVGPVLEKLMKKLGLSVPTPSAPSATDLDDIPNLDDLGDLDS